MSFHPFYPLVVLVRILRRDGLAFFAKAAKHCVSPKAWIWLLRGGRHPEAVRRVSAANLRTIRESRWFDAEWYLREHIDVRRARLDPVRHFASFGHLGLHDPGPDFCVKEYFELNEDVRRSGMNPLVHFERLGRKENRLVSFLQVRESSFPEGAVETERAFPAAPRRHRRVAVFAAYFPNGRIPETTLCYLRGLRDVADDVLFVANCPVFPDEIEKLEGLVRFALFRHHGGHDFYSYRLGWLKARELGLLDPAATDEAVLANDSCYAPVYPFPECFAKMADHPCDFWGMTANSGVFDTDHVQSFFFVFRRTVLDGEALDRFLRGVEVIPNRWLIIGRYEVGLTAALSAAGHSWDTLVPRDFKKRRPGMPTKRVMETMTEYGMPLVKIRAMNGDMVDDRSAVLDFIRAHNPALAAAIPPPAPPPDHEAIRRVREEHAASFGAKIGEIRRARVEKGLPVRAVFFVSSPSMFPARALFEKMRRDPAFEARIVVSPDMRWPDRDPDADMESCRDELLRSLPDANITLASQGPGGLRPDATRDADLVCYPIVYDYSDIRCNPRWAVGRPFLPVYVHYGVPVTVYARDVMELQGYACFWKVFAECDATAKEYAEHSILKGANAEVVGAVKMDALAAAQPWPRNGGRKRVLIAPHHSVEGGANDSLALSNFQRYADFFLALPERHPELDFVFRPHPFLFTVLAHPSRWGQRKVDDWIARMKAHPNVRWSDEGDYLTVFASCDACVQDCSSFLFEWLFTGKPGCYMLKSPHDAERKFSPFGRQCLAQYDLAYDEKAIESFLRDVVEGGIDPKAAARDEFRKSIMVNYPHAADAALAGIKRALGIAK